MTSGGGKTTTGGSVMVMLLTAAEQAISEKRYADAEQLATDFADVSVDDSSETEAGMEDPWWVDRATQMYFRLASATQKAVWIDKMLLMRRLSQTPLDGGQTQSAVSMLERFDPGPSNGREVYCTWLEPRVMDQIERALLARLRSARARE